MLMPYVETAIAFALVMLAGSLIVNILVRLLQHWRRERARGVQAMLGQLHRGFSRAQGYSVPRAIDDAARWAFVDAVLTSPILHDDRAMAEFEEAADVGAATLERRRKRLHERMWREIEYVSQDDLIEVIAAASARDGKVPAAWFARTGVSGFELLGHVQRWFKTSEATARERFAIAARRASVVVAGLLVVLLNLDALRLAYDLYGDRVLTERLVQRQGDLMKHVAPAPAPGPGKDPASEAAASTPQTPQTPRAAGEEIMQIAAVLTVERVPIGWQDSWIAKRWCAYNEACHDARVPRPGDWKEMRADLMMWVIGLIASWVMLSLGAPFWVDLLKKLSNLKNLVQESARAAAERPEPPKAEIHSRDGSGNVVSVAVQGPTPPAPDPQ